MPKENPYAYLSQPDNMPVEPEQYDAKGEKLLKNPGSERADVKSHSNVDDDLPLKDEGMDILKRN